jgi:hypothetical protein
MSTEKSLILLFELNNLTFNRSVPIILEWRVFEFKIHSFIDSILSAYKPFKFFDNYKTFHSAFYCLETRKFMCVIYKNKNRDRFTCQQRCYVKTHQFWTFIYIIVAVLWHFISKLAMGIKIFFSNWSRWTLSFVGKMRYILNSIIISPILAIRNVRNHPSMLVKALWWIIIG